MNTRKIRELYKKLKDDHEHLIFVEKEITDLLFAIADYILKKETECDSEEFPPGYMLISEFCDTYFFISEGSIRNYLKNDDSFREKCSITYHGTTYILAKEAADYFYNIPTYRRRMDRIVKIQNKDVSCNK